MFYIIWLVMMITMMDHIIYNASYNLFAALLIEIENRGAQKYFSDAESHTSEFCCIIFFYSQTEHGFGGQICNELLKNLVIN